MASIKTRVTAGSGATVMNQPLTNAEIDTNFINLNTDKVEQTDAVSANTANKVVRRDASGNFFAGTISATLSGTATQANNINGGVAGAIPWQSAVGTTGLTAAGTAGQIFKSNGASVPTWVDQSSLAAGTAATLATTRTIGDVNFNGSANIVPERVAFKDTRATNFNPYTYSGVTLHFKQNTADGLNDGGTYHGVLNLWPYSDTSGGLDHQIAVSDNGNVFHRHSSGSTAWTAWRRFISSTDTTNTLQIDSLGVGTAASGTTGELRATNAITSFYSDERLKENVQVIENALDKVEMLVGVTYTANDLAAQFGLTNKEQQVGVLAGDAAKAQPEVVKPAPFDIGVDEEGNEYSLSGENYKTVQYEKLVPLLIQAIKELRAEVKELKGSK